MEQVVGSIRTNTQSSMGECPSGIEVLKMEIEILRTEVDHLYELIKNTGGMK